MLTIDASVFVASLRLTEVNYTQSRAFLAAVQQQSIPIYCPSLAITETVAAIARTTADQALIQQAGYLVESLPMMNLVPLDVQMARQRRPYRRRTIGWQLGCLRRMKAHKIHYRKCRQSFLVHTVVMVADDTASLFKYSTPSCKSVLRENWAGIYVLRRKLMLFVALALLSHTASTPVSITDKSALTHLHRLIAQRSDKKAWFVKFERELPASNISTWQRLQKQMHPNSRAYAETSFVLAYYGVDYPANLRRVLRPYTVWYKDSKSNSSEYTKQYPQEDSDDIDLNEWGSVFYALNLLYLKHHDLKSLGAWLDLKLSGALSEDSDGELSDLWKRHNIDMLHAAYGHPQRITNLAEALLGEMEDKALVRALIQDVKRFTRLPDRRAALTAQQVIRGIQQDEQQFQRQYAH